MLVELADAFERHDRAAIAVRIADGWSGFRFTESWTDANWSTAAAALRTARLTASTDTVRTFSIVFEDPGAPARPRSIEVVLGNQGWQLDYSSFMGPFPHL